RVRPRRPHPAYKLHLPPPARPGAPVPGRLLRFGGIGPYGRDTVAGGHDGRPRHRGVRADAARGQLLGGLLHLRLERGPGRGPGPTPRKKRKKPAAATSSLLRSEAAILI